MAQERDRLAKRLADQEESHKAALKAVQDSEAALQAEYETEAASWAEAKQTLINGYGQIEDLVDEYFPGYSTTANQVVEAHREARRQAGAEIAPNAGGAALGDSGPPPAGSSHTPLASACWGAGVGRSLAW